MPGRSAGRNLARMSLGRSYTESMPRLSRTLAVTLVAGGGFLVACGHLPFEDIPDTGDGGGPEAGALADGPVGDETSSGFDGGVDAKVDAAVDAADGGCAGPSCVGTFVSSAIGDDANPGTSSKPVKTITKAIAIAVALGGTQSVYVAASHYPEKITLSEGVDLLGGYDCSAISCTWARDPTANDTAILDQDFEGVLAPKTITRKTLFDGFRVAGKAGVPTTATGSAAMSLVGGSPTVTHCKLAGGDVTGSTSNARSIGLAISGPSSVAAGALVDQNSIGGGTSTDQSIGVHLLGASALGGGAPVAVVTSNRIRGGVAANSVGVLAWASATGTLLERNDIAPGTSTAAGASWGIVVQSTMTIDSNRINADVGLAATCPQGAGVNFCGGIFSQGSTTTIVNNVVLGGSGPKTCAVLLADGEVGVGAVILNGNTLDGAGNAGGDGTVSTAVALRITAGTSAALGKVRNNILLGGLNKNRYGVYEESSPGKTVRSAALDNNDFWNAGTARDDFAYRVWTGNGATDLTFAQLAQIPSPVPAANVSVDALVNASYHIPQNSPVVDKGTSTEAPSKDIDGDNRPKGAAVDIGADEVK